VDNTILNVALPTLVRVRHATSSERQWVVDSYAMVFAGLLLVGAQSNYRRSPELRGGSYPRSWADDMDTLMWRLGLGAPCP
jgi:hypothetical protein